MRNPLITRLSPCGRCAVAIAAVLMFVQAFLAGLVGAQAALLGTGDLAVICHGRSGATAEPRTVPDTPEKQHPCCESCTAGAPPAVLPLPVAALRITHCRPCGSPALRAISIPLAARAVRAGPSQAPPSPVGM